MITTVEMYQTNDGKIHTSITAAEEYVLNQAAEIFVKRLPLQGCQGLNLTASEQYKIVDALTKDINTLKKLFSELELWLEER